MLKTLVILIASLTLAQAQSPKAAADMVKPRLRSESSPNTLWVSHAKQIGTIGTLQVHQIKIRGLDCPNLTAAVLLDPVTGAIQIIGPATGAGLAHSIVQSGGNVGAAAVFGMHLRPNHETISNGSTSSATGTGSGTATSSNANSNTANGGNGGNGGSGGSGGSGGFTPPGQIDNPGHDGNPGNPH